MSTSADMHPLRAAWNKAIETGKDQWLVCVMLHFTMASVLQVTPDGEICEHVYGGYRRPGEWEAIGWAGRMSSGGITICMPQSGGLRYPMLLEPTAKAAKLKARALNPAFQFTDQNTEDNGHEYAIAA